MKTKLLWEKYYPVEPFDYHDLPPSYEEVTNASNNNSSIEYNLEAAVLRQKDFYYQVRKSPHLIKYIQIHNFTGVAASLYGS